MATQTFEFARFSGPDGEVIAEIDVNDANWRAQKARAHNNSVSALKVTVKDGGVTVWTGVAPANETTTWNLSPFQLGWDDVNGGLILGNYSIGTQWPAEP